MKKVDSNRSLFSNGHQPLPHSIDGPQEPGAITKQVGFSGRRAHMKPQWHGCTWKASVPVGRSSEDHPRAVFPQRRGQKDSLATKRLMTPINQVAGAMTGTLSPSGTGVKRSWSEAGENHVNQG